MNQSKVKKKSDHKDTKDTALKSEQQSDKPVRKASSARPSVLPGASAGKAAPDDWLVKVNVIKGTDLRKAALFGQIDPFCEVTCGLTSLTKVVPQSQNPEWNSKLNFFGEAGSVLPEKVKLVVKDHNQYTASAIVGETEVSLKDLWEKGTTFNNAVELQFKSKGAGKVTLQISCLFETVTEKPSS